MTDERYPDPPVDANEGDQIIRALREMDYPHWSKAAILAKMARMEYRFALADGEPGVEGYDPDDFLDFIEETDSMIDGALENVDQ